MRSNQAERGHKLRWSRWLLAFGLGVAALSLSPRAARAEDDVTLSMARERFKEGVQYFDQELYDKARAAFVQAYALRKHPAVLLNLAQSEVRSGHEAEAAAHFAQYLREHKEATEAERQGALSGLATAKASVMEVSLEVDTEGAEIFVDQTLEGTSPLPGPLYLAPGKHTVLARKDTREDSVEIDAVAGQSRPLTLRPKRGFHPSAAPAAPSRKAEPAPTAPPPDETSVEMESEGFFSWFADSPVAWIGGGLTLAGIAGGVGFSLGSTDSYDSADSVLARIRQEAAKDGLPTTQGLCSNPAAALMGASSPPADPASRAADYEKACARYSDNIDSGDNLKTLSTVSWVVAGVAATGTIIYYFADRDTAPSEARRRSRPAIASARFVPWISPGERGLAIVGEF